MINDRCTVISLYLIGFCIVTSLFCQHNVPEFQRNRGHKLPTKERFEEILKSRHPKMKNHRPDDIHERMRLRREQLKELAEKKRQMQQEQKDTTPTPQEEKQQL